MAKGETLSNVEWQAVLDATDFFLEEAARKDHNGPGDDYQDLVESWSKPMQCVAVAYLIQNGQPQIAHWVAGSVFSWKPLSAGFVDHPELCVELPWLPR